MQSIEVRSTGGAATPRQKGVSVLRLVALLQVSALGGRIHLRREEGQTMTEYGVLLALIALVVLVAIIALGPKIVNLFSYVGSQL